MGDAKRRKAMLGDRYGTLSASDRRYRIPINQLAAALQFRLGRGLMAYERGYPLFFWLAEWLDEGVNFTTLVNSYDPASEFLILDVSRADSTKVTIHSIDDEVRHALSKLPLARAVEALVEENEAIARRAICRWDMVAGGKSRGELMTHFREPI